MNDSSRLCFICNGSTTSASYSVSKYRLETSRQKLVAVLGKILGDRFIVVCHETDVVCKTCVNIFNKLDTLDVESTGVRKIVVRLLERKFRLKPGTLSRNLSDTNSILQQLERESDDDTESVEDSKDARSRVWLQCDKCEYTTNYTTFVKRHVRSMACAHCSAPLVNGHCSTGCSAISKDDISEPAVDIHNDSNSITLFNGEGSDQAFLVTGNDTIEYNLDGELSSPEETTISQSGKKAVYLQLVEGTQRDASGMRQVLAVTDAGSGESMYIKWEDEMTEETTPGGYLQV